MISTVTTSTITTVTTIAAFGLTTFIGVAAIVGLIVFLVTKELAGASLAPRSQLTGRLLNVPIIPMCMVFGVIVAVKIAEVLG